VLCGCERKPEAKPDLLATVGPESILVDEFRAQILRRGGLRPEAVDREALLQEMIDAEALYAKALQAGLDNDPEVRRAYRNLLVGKLKERDLNPRLEKIAVTAADVRTYYDQNRDRYTLPARVRLAVVALNVSPTLRAEQKEALHQRLEEARHRILQETTLPAERGFGALAIECSEDQASRYRGGDIGWIEAGRGHARWSQAVLDAGFALGKVGEVSDVISDAQGVYLVRLVDRRDSSAVPLAEVEEEIRHRLLRDQRAQLERDFVREIRRALPIQVYTQALAQVTLPEGVRRPPDEPRPPALP